MIISNYDALVTINGTGISGASLSSFSRQDNLKLIGSLGQPYVCQLPDGFSVVNFSITKPLCISGGEPLAQLTGDIAVSGTIQTNSASISFTSGYASNYNVNYSLNEGPNATLEFMVFGRIGNDRVTNPTYFGGGNHFAKRSLIDLDISGAAGLISDFNYSIEINRVPVFVLGNDYPIEVKTIGPRKFSLKAGGYIDDQINFESNPYHVSGSNSKCYLDLTVSGGVSGNVLLDRQSGLFDINSKNISISSDDELSFDIDATRYF